MTKIDMTRKGPWYGRHDPKGWCGDPSRGAALGRPSIHDVSRPDLVTCRLYLRKIRLNDGGYDCNGTYFGHGAPLYWCSSGAEFGVFDAKAPSHDGGGDWLTFEIDFMIRAPSREAAKAYVRDLYPNARFYR